VENYSEANAYQSNHISQAALSFLIKNEEENKQNKSVKCVSLCWRYCPHVMWPTLSKEQVILYCCL